MDNSIEQQREHFESISEKYFNARKTPNHLYVKELMWQFFFKDKSKLKNTSLSVLEPMCGYSEGKSILEKNIGVLGSYEGFDYSSNLIEKVKQSNKELNVYVQDISTFNSDKKFDIIIIIGGLHHVPFICNDVMKNLKNNLSEKGVFIVLEPTHNNIIFKKIRERIYNKNSLFDQETEKAFELKELNNLFTKNGFKLEDQIYPGLLSYILFYNPDAFPFLNIGNKGLVKFLFKLDTLFFRNFIGRKLSFATLSMLTHN